MTDTNYCEHCHEEAPPRKRFCSEACRECESTPHETGCSGLCIPNGTKGADMSNENENQVPEVVVGPKPRREFEVHLLNEQGITKALNLGLIFSRALDEIEAIAGDNSREAALVRTHLETASYYAKRAMAQRPENQKTA